ncbi:MAG: radical SAM protein [Candidatus Wallbacteria bacterium]|nr:radical SAM protein [Candidatus Wallbacteria bacterium]
MIRVSAATAALISSPGKRPRNLPICTTAYLLLGSHCSGGCRFCSASARETAGHTRLSRITWPVVDLPVANIISSINNCSEFKRICVQMTIDSLQDYLDLVEQITRLSSISISLSVNPGNRETASGLLKLQHVEYLSLALDAATKQVFEQVKSGSWDQHIRLLHSLAEEFPGRIRTHLIMGLGETEKELVGRMLDLKERNIAWGLFAFFPLKSTPMEHVPQPDQARWRLIQVLQHGILYNLLKNGSISFDSDGKVLNYHKSLAINKAINSGTPFLTTGCPGCNRPYYNERPGHTPYNFHRLPDQEEIESIIEQLNGG